MGSIPILTVCINFKYRSSINERGELFILGKLLKGHLFGKKMSKESKKCKCFYLLLIVHNSSTKTISYHISLYMQWCKQSINLYTGYLCFIFFLWFCRISFFIIIMEYQNCGEIFDICSIACVTPAQQYTLNLRWHIERGKLLRITTWNLV